MANLQASAIIARQDFLDYMELATTDITRLQATWIDRRIEGVTREIQNYCGRKFKKSGSTRLNVGYYRATETPYDSKYDGNGTKFLFLKNYPVASVATLLTTYYTEDGIADVSTINTDDYRLYGEEGILELTKAPDVWGRFVEAPQSVWVYYHAGFTATEMPSDLKDAACEMIKLRWDRKKRTGDLKSESLDGARFDYDLDKMFPKWVEGILDSYRRNSL